MRTYNIVLKFILILFFLSLFTPLQAAENNDRPLIFGVHPYLHPTTLIERFTPLTDYLAKQMGQDILIRVGSDYNDHIEAIIQGKVDFAFLGPSLYIKLTQNNKQFTPLGRLSFSGKKLFRGAIIVRQDSNIKSLKDLRGKKFALGDPDSTLSSLLPISMLSDAGIQLEDLSEYTHLTNHHNVALSVLLGKYDAGGVKEEVLNEYQSRGLKAIQWSPEIPTHLFVARAGLPQQKINTLSQLLQNLHKQTGASDILQNIKKGTTAIIPAKLEEYGKLRELIAPLQGTLPLETGN